MLARFLAELKRRHVYRVGAGYAAVAFVVLQGAELVLPAMGVSDEAFRLLVVLVLAGFPVALILAWLFELTPDGVRRSEESDEPLERGRWVAAWGVALLASAMMLGSAGWWFLRSAPTATETAEADSVDLDPRSLAVMPFANLSGDPEDEYFSDGITDAVISALARVRGLRVASRTSTFALKDAPRTLPEIAEELGVASVLEGSVRRSDDVVRVDVHLSDARGGFEVWTERYERPMEDIFVVQDAIAQSIVRVLEVTLAERPAEPLVAAPTQDGMAYDKYLWGEYNRNKRTPEGLRDAVGNFEDAIMRDSAFAPAYAGLAETYLQLSLRPGRESADRQTMLARADSLASAALALDDGLAAAYAARALVLMEQHYDWDGAEADLRYAVELAPRAASHRQTLATLLALRGTLDGAMAEAREATRLDPLSPAPHSDRGQVLEIAGDLDAAERAYRRALDLNPDFSSAKRHLGFLLMRSGRADEAADLLRVAERPGSAPSEPKALLADLRSEPRGLEGVSATMLAPLFVLTGDIASSVEALRRSRADGTLSSSLLMRVLAMPDFRDSTEGAAFLAEVGLRSEPLPSTSAAVEPSED